MRIQFLLTPLLLLTACSLFQSDSERQKKISQAAVKKILAHDSPVLVTPIDGGTSSASLFLADAGEAKYVVRFLSGNSEDLTREISCMQTASESGYGPKIRYADAEKGIVVMDYLRPEEPPQSDALLTAIADLLRSLHTGPAFPDAPAMFDQISGLVESLLQTHKGVLAEEQAGKIVKALEEMRPCVEARPLAPCHRDLNPNNLLYSKDRLFAIDYEMAAQDNPLFDLASIANFYRLGSAQEELFFSSYLQRAPTAEESAELYLMKQVVLLSFSLRLLAKIPPAALDPPPQLTSRQMLMLARPSADDLKKPAYKYAIATLMLRAALQSFDSVQYRTALALLK